MSRLVYCDQKMIDLDACEVVYDTPFTPESLEEDFEAPSGHWSVKDGWLVGVHRENSGGMLYTKQSWDFDLIMEFDAEAIPPCKNDLNFVIKTSGWDSVHHDAGPGYIFGLGGWWLDKAGIEKYPTCKPRCLTELYPLESGKLYHIIAGVIDGHCFFYANGKLVCEMYDPAPEDFVGCGKIGFDTYASQIRYKDLRVYRAAYTERTLEYTANF